MFEHFLNSRKLWLGIAFAGSLATASTTFAGECPADKVLKMPQKIDRISDDSKLKGEVVNSVDGLAGVFVLGDAGGIQRAAFGLRDSRRETKERGRRPHA